MLINMCWAKNASIVLILKYRLNKNNKQNKNMVNQHIF